MTKVFINILHYFHNFTVDVCNCAIHYRHHYKGLYKMLYRLVYTSLCTSFRQVIILVIMQASHYAGKSLYRSIWTNYVSHRENDYSGYFTNTRVTHYTMLISILVTLNVIIQSILQVIMKFIKIIQEMKGMKSKVLLLNKFNQASHRVFCKW